MTNPLRAAARLLTGAVYAKLGYDAWVEPGARVETAGPTLAAIRGLVPLPEDDELLVRVNGAVQAVAGTAVVTGVLPRVAGVALVGSMVPTTLAGHAFWKAEDPATRKTQQLQLAKNVAMIGGLLYVVLDRGGR